MRITVQFEVPDHSMAEVKKVRTMRGIAEGIVQSFIDSDSRIGQARVVSLKDDHGQIFHEVHIDMLGILRVVGGYMFQDSTGREYKMILVDDGGTSNLIFELRDKQAFFYGALTGLELERFNSSTAGGYFSYYNRMYKKLSMKEVGELINHGIEYRHEPGDALESARKGTSGVLYR